MSVKIKSKHSRLSADKLGEITQQAGLLLMTAAVTFCMVELTEHPGTRIVLPNQPALAHVSDNNGGDNPIRREREEAGPHHISYSTYQRTPGRSGRA